MSEQDKAQTPEIGALGMDIESGRVGVVMDVARGQVWLRPPGGGREWTVPLGRVRPVAESTDALRAKVADVNRHRKAP